MRNLTVKLLLAVTALSCAIPLLAQEKVDATDGVAIRIDDLVITEFEFAEIFRNAVRQKYYHGRVPEAELEEFRKRVAGDIVTQVIVHRDAQQKGLEPDRELIGKEVARLDSSNQNNPEWENQREDFVSMVTRQLERQSLLRRMESSVREVPQPSAEQVAAYYRDNPDKFTEPQQVWGSVILLSVPPSAGEEMWSEAEAVARQLKFRVSEGEDFAALAKQFSGHASAVNGGDLGYLHEGMLETKVQQQVDALQVDQMTDPIRVLEGVLLFRMNGVREARLRPFEDVNQRAAGLLYRDLQESAWDDYLRDLRNSADIYVSEKLVVQE